MNSFKATAAPSATPFTHSALTEQVHAVCEDIERTVARRTAALAADAEREARVNRENGRAVFEAMAASIRRQQTASVAEAEQHRLMRDPTFRRRAAAAPGLLTEIERLGNTAAADAAMELERAERVHADRLAASCEQLIRVVARKRAATETDHEQQIQATRRTGVSVFAELAATVRRATAATAAAEQQLALILARPWSAEQATAVSEARWAVNTLIARRGAVAGAIEAMERERERRVHADALAVVCEQLERTVARRSATLDAEYERQSRVAAAAKRETLDDLRRRVAALEADEACDAEQRRRIHEDEAQFYCEGRRCHDKTLSEGWTAVHGAVEQRGRCEAVISAADAERQEREHVDAMHAVCDDIRRSVAQKHASAAAAAEQQTRVSRERGRTVFESAALTVRRAQSAADAEAERLRQVASPPQIVGLDAAAEVLADIERKGNAAAADAAMEQERAERMHADRVAAMCEQLVRTIARRDAATEADHERQSRITAELGRAVVAELRSAADRRWAADAASAEQTARSDGEGDYWASPDDRLLDALHELRVTIERRGNAAAADAATEQERTERIHANQLAVVNDQLRRSAAQAAVIDAMERERDERVHSDRMESTFEEISRINGREQVIRDAEAERRRRSSADFVQPTECIKHMKRDVCASIELGNSTVVLPASPSSG